MGRAECFEYEMTKAVKVGWLQSPGHSGQFWGFIEVEGLALGFRV